MIRFKTEEEVALMKVSALLVSSTLAEIAKVLKPGMTTMQLDKLANEYIKDHQAIPSFYQYSGYPFHICTSVNDVIVHGMPNLRPLLDGDLISVDIGVEKDGYHGDHAYTFLSGEVTPEMLKLVRSPKSLCIWVLRKPLQGTILAIFPVPYSVIQKKRGMGWYGNW